MAKNRNLNKNIFLFDLDGTLIETDNANFLAYREAILKIKGINLFSLNLYRERFTREKLKSIIPNLSELEYQKIIELKNTVYKKYLHETKINTLVLKAIQEYKKNSKIVLVTNSSKKRANLILEYHKLINIFDYIFYKEDLNNQKNSKFEYALEYLNIDPRLVIIFENDESEIKEAKFVGIPTQNIIKVKGKKYRE